jgi:hypothetical protein
MYGLLPTAFLDQDTNAWTVPCDSEVNVTIRFLGVDIVMHPLDMVVPSGFDDGSCQGTVRPCSFPASLPPAYPSHSSSHSRKTRSPTPTSFLAHPSCTTRMRSSRRRASSSTATRATRSFSSSHSRTRHRPTASSSPRECRSRPRRRAAPRLTPAQSTSEVWRPACWGMVQRQGHRRSCSSLRVYLRCCLIFSGDLFVFTVYSLILFHYTTKTSEKETRRDCILKPGYLGQTA